MAKYTNLSSLFTAIADAIRAKKGTTDTIVADNFPDEIAGIETGNIKTATFTYSAYTNVGGYKQIAIKLSDGIDTINGFMFMNQNVTYNDGSEVTSDEIFGFYSSCTSFDNPVSNEHREPDESSGSYRTMYPYTININTGEKIAAGNALFYISNGYLILTDSSIKVSSGTSVSGLAQLYSIMVMNRVTHTLYYW